MTKFKQYQHSMTQWALTKSKCQELALQSLLNLLLLTESSPSILPKPKPKRTRQQTVQSLQKSKQQVLVYLEMNCLQLNLKTKPRLNWLFNSLTSPRSTGLVTNSAMVLTVCCSTTQRRLSCIQTCSILTTSKGTSQAPHQLPRMMTMHKTSSPSTTFSSSLRA